MTFASAVLEAIDAILALAYIGLQIYYGVCYHIQVFKFVANILVLCLYTLQSHGCNIIRKSSIT